MKSEEFGVLASEQALTLNVGFFCLYRPRLIVLSKRINKLIEYLSS